jgi:hypothetical protein
MNRGLDALDNIAMRGCQVDGSIEALVIDQDPATTHKASAVDNAEQVNQVRCLGCMRGRVLGLRFFSAGKVIILAMQREVFGAYRRGNSYVCEGGCSRHRRSACLYARGI